MSHIRGTRVTIPEFEIVSQPTVRIREVRERRFNILDRYAELIRSRRSQEEIDSFWQDLEGKCNGDSG